MVSKENWVFLVYQLPREPSTPRIAVWRRLRRLGVAQLSDGLVALPYDSSTKEQLEWVANQVVEAGGTASIWLTTPTVRRFGRTLAETLASVRAEEYSEVIAKAEAALEAEPIERRRALRRLRAELRGVQQRDHFPPPERSEATAALEALAGSLYPEVAQ